jgi:uncharacterized membrane protein YjfL (UPF0719 family)
MIFWDEVLIPAGMATLAGIVLAAIPLSVSIHERMSRGRALMWTEVASVLLLLASALGAPEVRIDPEQRRRGQC